jgi:hypothetical protein
MVASSALKSLPSSNSRRRRLIVMERGSSTFARDSLDEFDETVAVTQLHGERPDDFAKRVLRRIAGAERSGQNFQAAMLMAGKADDDATRAARRMIALAISAHAKLSGIRPEVVLMASPDASPDARARLLELVDELVCGAEGEPLPVRLCFSDTKPAAELRSGVFLSLAENE